VNAAAGELRPRDYTHAEIQHCNLHLEDSLAANLFNVPRSSSQPSAEPLNLIDAYRFMRSAIAGGGRVLVHCAQGKSRSSSVVLFYLIKTRDIHVHIALKQLQAVRPIAQPNPAFMQQLRTYCQSEEIVE
jgi:protein-tyrosine phosphatase